MRVLNLWLSCDSTFVDTCIPDSIQIKLILSIIYLFTRLKCLSFTVTSRLLLNFAFVGLIYLFEWKLEATPEKKKNGATRERAWFKKKWITKPFDIHQLNVFKFVVSTQVFPILLLLNTRLCYYTEMKWCAAINDGKNNNNSGIEWRNNNTAE
jgi:hypothetical protein